MGAASPIRVQNLNYSYGRGALRRQVLFDIDVEINQGEIVIVTGPSGSGKTTLLTLVGALRSASDGDVQVLGEQLRRARAGTLERVRRQIGFIFQQHNLLGALSAAQNVELGARVTRRYPVRERKRKSEEILQAVGMGERMHHLPAQLSGGQRQRVAIARALVGAPAILLADEPTASLDRQSGREVVEIMRRLAREDGTTILLVTHDNRILDIADRIVHLEDGRLSTFTDSVIANNELMMQALADSRRKQNLHTEVDELDEHGFQELLEEMTAEARSFIDATRLAGDKAFGSMLEQGLSAFTRKLGHLLKADKVSLFLLEGDELALKVAENLAEIGEVRLPVGAGLVGAVAGSGEIIRIDDAYQDPRFNQAVDRQTGYRTRSVLCLPIKDQAGRIFAVAQLLNRKDGQPFDAQDEQKFTHFMASIGVIYESMQLLSDHRGAGPQDHA